MESLVVTINSSTLLNLKRIKLVCRNYEKFIDKNCLFIVFAESLLQFRLCGLYFFKSKRICSCKYGAPCISENIEGMMHKYENIKNKRMEIKGKEASPYNFIICVL